MESEEALNYYIDEAKDSSHETEIEEQVPTEAEQAKDFLQKVGLSDLTKLFSEGHEITENVVNDSVRQRHLTERQAQTVRSRIRTLNKTLHHNRQTRRKQRQDVRDVAWNVETSSTGTRSRSATPDSLDSVEGVLNDDNVHSYSDEEQHLLSLPLFTQNNVNSKTKVKWTASEPLQDNSQNGQQKKIISRGNDKGDVAHLGSENVVLKGYQPLNECSPQQRIYPQRERSGSDPSTDVHVLQPLQQKNSTHNLHTPLSRSHGDNISSNNCTKVYLNGAIDTEPEAVVDDQVNVVVSFEGLIQQNKFSDEVLCEPENLEEMGVSIDDFTDSDYQYLKPLLYVELVAIFDSYKIKFLKRKASTKYKGGNVFGVNLSTLVMRDMPRPSDKCIPEIFQSVIKQLNERCIREDGILRVGGQKLRLDTLFAEIEAKFFTHRREMEGMFEQATVHELTGVLKKLLRDLPDPVFTMELFDMFYKTGVITNVDDKKRALNLLVLLLPMENRNTFKLLLQFFLNIIENEQYNRMNLHNVAMITAPSFFPPRLLLPNNKKLIVNKLSKEELTKQINGAAVCCCLMETMLQAGLKMWIVPHHLAHQAIEASQKKAQEKRDAKDKKNRFAKTKLVRSSTQYESGSNNSSPRVRKNFLV